MNKLLLYVLPELIVPGVFGRCLWGSRYAEGWVALVHGACLGFVVPMSGIVGGALMGLAFVQRGRGRQDWRWLVASAGIVGSPALLALLNQAFT
jgi:hypothetical protein